MPVDTANLDWRARDGMKNRKASDFWDSMDETVEVSSCEYALSFKKREKWPWRWFRYQQGSHHRPRAHKPRQQGCRVGFREWGHLFGFNCPGCSCLGPQEQSCCQWPRSMDATQGWGDKATAVGLENMADGLVGQEGKTLSQKWNILKP